MSYDLLPMLGLQSIQPAGWAIMKIASWMFLMALQLGAPIILALFLSDLTFGIIAQTVPQMNIFIVGFPIKIMIGFTFLIATIYLFGEFMGSVFEEMFYSIENILRLMG
jgi:flagellar biosynthetic protein FliR